MRYKVQKRVALKGPSGVGQVWETIARNKRQATAESIAIRARIDHDDAVRVVQQ